MSDEMMEQLSRKMDSNEGMWDDYQRLGVENTVLRRLVYWCHYYGIYDDCNRGGMDEDMRKLYDEIVGEKKGGGG